MADYGFQVFDSSGRLWVGSDDLISRVVAVVNVNANDREESVSVPGINSGNAITFMGAGILNNTVTGDQGIFWADYAEIYTGGVRVKASSFRNGNQAKPAKVIVMRIK